MELVFNELCVDSNISSISKSEEAKACINNFVNLLYSLSKENLITNIESTEYFRNIEVSPEYKEWMIIKNEKKGIIDERLDGFAYNHDISQMYPCIFEPMIKNVIVLKDITLIANDEKDNHIYKTGIEFTTKETIIGEIKLQDTNGNRDVKIIKEKFEELIKEGYLKIKDSTLMEKK